MSHQQKQVKYSKSRKKPSQIGTKKVESEQLEPLRVTDDRILTPSSILKATPESDSFTQLAATNKNQTSKDKLTTCNLYSQTGNSSKKSGEDSITSGKVCYPFWDKFCQETSEKLWSATKKDSLGLVLTSSNSFVNNKIASSWFSTEQTCLENEKSLKISLQSSMSSVLGSTPGESTNLLSKKIRIYPETKLAKIWRAWIAAARWCFNQAIAILKTENMGKYDLRKQIMDSAPEWVKATPYNPRQLAVFQAFDAHKAAKKSKGCAKFRSRFDNSQTIRFQTSNWKSGTFYPQATKGLSFKASEPIIDVMQHGAYTELN